MVGEVKLSITRSWVHKLSLLDERSNRETSRRIGFYNGYLVSLQGLPFIQLYFIYIDLHRLLFIHCLRQHSQSTSASVERSFSMMKKLLAKDRNYSVANVIHYIILHYNFLHVVNGCRVECCVFRVFLIFIRFNFCFNTEI